MEEILDLKSSPLFEGIKPEKLEKLFHCLGAYTSSYNTEEVLVDYGDEVSSIGTVLKGKVDVCNPVNRREKMTSSSVGPGMHFCEALACSRGMKSCIKVVATESCDVLWLPTDRIASVCHYTCIFHIQLTSNLMRLLAHDNLAVWERLDVVSRRTTRDKLDTYLSYRMNEVGQPFEIPLNRNQLAEHLCVDRSAMSRELGHMRDEGIIEFRANEFRYLKATEKVQSGKPS